MERPRPIVVHIHLFKNAGSSVDAGLEAHFGSHWEAYDQPGGGVFGQQHLRDFADQRPSLTAFSSHQLRPPLTSDEAFEFIPIVFLRHPLDRIRSAFDFERRQGPTTESSRVASESDLAQWLQFHQEKRSAQCRNFHVMSLSTLRDQRSGILYPGVSDEEHFESAKSFLCSLETFGLVERYEESWHRIRMMLQRCFPEFESGISRRNITPDRASSVEDRVEDMRLELGTTAFRFLRESNELDTELVRWAGRHFERMS